MALLKINVIHQTYSHNVASGRDFVDGFRNPEKMAFGIHWNEATPSTKDSTCSTSDTNSSLVHKEPMLCEMIIMRRKIFMPIITGIARHSLCVIEWCNETKSIGNIAFPANMQKKLFQPHKNNWTNYFNRERVEILLIIP